MRNSGVPEIFAFARTMSMLEAMLDHAAAGGRTGSEEEPQGRRGHVSAVARRLGMPVSTAHRQVATLVAEGLLLPVGHGRFVAGPRLKRLSALFDIREVVTGAALAPLNDLAARTRSIAQLGSFEDNMVTYRLKAGHGAAKLFTRVGMQLEAYCSGIGKVLLAYLPPQQQAAYLADGPFPRLTANTITDPEALANELAAIRQRGYAVDDEEIAEGLRCFAAPVRDGDGTVVAAISLSTAPTNRTVRALGDDGIAELVCSTASEIAGLAFDPVDPVAA